MAKKNSSVQEGLEMHPFTSIELCSGAGGQALGIEQAGFEHSALVEIDSAACATLRHNRPHWNVIEGDLRSFSAKEYRGVDLVAAGVPCPPFSKAGKQLGGNDERDMFPEALRVVRECLPQAVMLENVRGLLDPVFTEYRDKLTKEFELLGYRGFWKLLNASDYGVPQLRPRVIFVALRPAAAAFFSWPTPLEGDAPTVGETLVGEMASGGWKGAKEWAKRANAIAPTLVGGSKKHGGPDLGPTRARAAWASLGVDGKTLANEPPPPGFKGMPKLTVKMAALIQGFPIEWSFVGKKTPAYRQVGNAFPPPVAKAVALRVAHALTAAKQIELGSTSGKRKRELAEVARSAP